MGADLEDRFRPQPALRPKIRRISLALIEVMRPVAYECGYALGVHGSLERDLDLIAAPWTDEAVTARQLAKALADGLSAARPHRWYWNGKPGLKPHGRTAWTLLSVQDGVENRAGLHPFIDLSVMPRRRRKRCAAP